MIAFGPVPSRRLGLSLGINHISPKHCPYSCVYCQVGRTTNMEIKRREFYPLDTILQDVEKKISQCSMAGKKIDYLTLVPDGEPTLDINLGKLTQGLKVYGIPVAVISNASLIDQQDVQDELLNADWISLKVDSVEESTWRKINRPHHQLSLIRILDSILTFRKKFDGELVTETMLISGLNDQPTATQLLCDFLIELQPFKSYLSIPTRPPAEPGITTPSAKALQETLKICSSRLSFIDLLFETEIGEFVTTGDTADDILSITAVHPLREEALRQMINRVGAEWNIVEHLLADGKISEILYRNERFFLRSFKQSCSK